MLIFDDAPADCFLPPANSHIDIFSSNSREFEQYSYLEVFKQRKVISFVSNLIFCLTFIYLVMIDKHMALRCFFSDKNGVRTDFVSVKPSPQECNLLGYVVSDKNILSIY